MIPQAIKQLFRRDDGSLNPSGFILLVLIVVLPAGLVFGFMGLMNIVKVEADPRAAQIQKELEQEFKAIPALPNARSAGYQSSHRLVSGKYLTGAPYPQIRAFYEDALTSHGWTLYEEREVNRWWRDLGGKSTQYCKGEYRAHLQYAGEQANYGWDFAFELSWGLDGVNAQSSETFLKAGCRLPVL
jgi:hypothetical protein